MVDLSQLSDDQLTRLYQSTRPQSAQTSQQTDLSKLSDDQLTRLYQSTRKIEQPKMSDGAISDFGTETASAFESGRHSLFPSVEATPPPSPDRGDSFWSGFLTGPFQRGAADIESAVGRAAAPITMLTSPVTGALQSFGGHGLAALESYAGQGSLAALRKLGLTRPDEQLPDQQAMYEQAKSDINKAMLAAGPARGASVMGAPWGEIGQGVQADIAAAKQAEEAKAAAAQAAKVKPPTETQQALQDIQGAGYTTRLPRALDFQNKAAQAGSVALSKFPWVGTPLDEAVRAVPKQMGADIETIAGQYSPKLPEDEVGAGIKQTLTGEAEQERAARTAQVEAANEAAQQQFERQQQAREQAIRDRQTQANDAAERSFGDVNPMEMAQDTINDVQAAHGQARDRRTSLYGDVNNLDARVHIDAFQNLRQRAEQALTDAGVSIDDPGTNAAKMLNEYDRLSGRPAEPAAIPEGVKPRVLDALKKTYGDDIPPEAWKSVGVEPPPPATEAIPPDFRLTGAHAPAPGADAISVQGLEQLSKRISRMGMDAETPSDRMASAIVKRSFDDWRNDALGSHLTADSAPNARPVIDAARAAHRDLMDRFGYNYGRLPEGEPRRAAKLLNQVVTGGAGPEALRDNLIGAKPGNRPTSAPLYEAISNAVPNPAEFRNRLRGAYWNSITSGGPSAIARKVEGLTPTRMGSHLFEPHEHDLMRGVADIAQRTPQDIAALAREKPPKPIKVEPGEAERFAKRAVGERSSEKVLTKFDTSIRKGGDIAEAGRTWSKLPEDTRNQVRASWLRSLGGEGDFSLGKFATNWNDYSDKAKDMMLGAEHRKDLDNFHKAAKAYQEALERYGNPSKTAQQTAWHKFFTGALKTGLGLATGTVAFYHPIGIAAAGLGARKLARIISLPQGAKELAKWSRVAQAYKDAPSTGKLALLSNLSRSLDKQ